MSNKILTRVKSAITGEEYYIGTVGAQENVSVQLSAPTTVDWTQLYVTVQNISNGTSQTVALDADGKCEFSVGMGEQYEVTFPIVSGYQQPLAHSYSASLAERTLEYTYTTEPIHYEQVDIEVSLHTMGSDTVALLDGMTVYAQDTDNVTYSGTFSNGYATLSIPYGKHYTLYFPTLSGYNHDHTGEEHTSGVVSREVIVNYTEIGIGVYGVKADGTLLLPSQIAEMITAGTLLASDIIAGAYNDSYLASASRGDGTVGCGFMWKIDNGTTSGAWASPSVDVDTDKLPYRSNETAALADCAGKHNTLIMDEEITNAGSTTIAHTLRNSQDWKLTVNNVDRQGFLPAYGQIKRLVNNRTDFEALYTALGKTAPTIWSGYWWTSCQKDAGNAVYLYGGGFNGDNNNKYFSSSVLCCFDL